VPRTRSSRSRDPIRIRAFALGSALIAFAIGAGPSPAPERSPSPAATPAPPPIVARGADGPFARGTRWFLEYSFGGLGASADFQADSNGSAWWRSTTFRGATVEARKLTADELRALDAAVAGLRPQATVASTHLVFDCYPAIRVLRLAPDGSVAERLKPDVPCFRSDQAPEVRAVVDLIDAIRKTRDSSAGMTIMPAPERPAATATPLPVRSP
jgi:hypothetical protein